MTTVCDPEVREPAGRRLRDRVEAEAYVASVCFKHGPPRLVGVELEWTVHYRDDPRRPIDPDDLAAALGAHAPRTLRPDSPAVPLPAGSPLTLEPGGQVEISALPHESFGALVETVDADTVHLVNLLAASGLELGTSGLDPHRTPRRVLDTPRYIAMETAFAPIGPHGITMMCNSAGLQVCLDAGEGEQVGLRWAAVTALGPVLTSLFSTSARPDWACARLNTIVNVDPSRTSPLGIVADPAQVWSRQVLDTPLLCRRQVGPCWDAPAGVTFADWIAGALPDPPTEEDLDYHITTMFPPVRPHGYLEVRYLDGQPAGDWLPAAALLTALMADDTTTAAALEVTVPLADAWHRAARQGLADPDIATAAAAVVRLGTDALPALGLPPPQADDVVRRWDGLVRQASGLA